VRTFIERRAGNGMLADTHMSHKTPLICKTNLSFELKVVCELFALRNTHHLERGRRVVPFKR
jgi:hypothetical protein